MLLLQAGLVGTGLVVSSFSLLWLKFKNKVKLEKWDLPNSVRWDFKIVSKSPIMKWLIQDCPYCQQNNYFKVEVFRLDPLPEERRGTIRAWLARPISHGHGYFCLSCDTLYSESNQPIIQATAN